MTRSTSLVAVCCSRASVRSRFRCLQFLEQSGILNGNHGLVSKGSHQIDLLVGKPIDFVPPKGKHSDHNAVSQQRHPQQGTVTFNTLLFL